MEHHSYRRLVLFSLLFALCIFGILWIKSLHYTGLGLVYIYTIGITTFMFSRVIGSLFYESPAKNISLSKLPSVTFIIPCKNEEESIYQTIIKCFTADYPEKKVEIIAIDDGSTDNTLKQMQRAKEDYPRRKLQIVHWEQNRGKRQGMAEGFRRAKGEIVIQLDSDSFVDKDAVKVIVRPFLHKDIGAVVGHTLPSNSDRNLMTRMQTAYYFMSFRALKATESIFHMVFCCSGCFSAYRRAYVLPILDEWLHETFLGKTVSFGDDRALTNQMLKNGYKAVYCDDALAYTKVPEKFRTFFKQQVRWKKGWFINSIKALRFVLKKDFFVAVTYFIPLIIFTLLTPFIAFRALILTPVLQQEFPLLYIVGILLVSLLLYAHYELHTEEKYGAYMLLWSILNMTLFSYILIYALFDLRNMQWGTR